METKLRCEALQSIDKAVRDVQLVVIVLTRELAYKVAGQLNEDAGEVKCLPCVKDRPFDDHQSELNKMDYPIVAGTLGRIDALLYRNVLKPLFIKHIYILDSVAMIYFPFKKTLEKVLGFVQKHTKISLHLPPCLSIVNQIREFSGTVSCYGVHQNLVEANHFALHVLNEIRKIDVLCEICQMHTSIPIMVCCGSNRTVYTCAKLLRSLQLAVVVVTSSLASDDIRIAIESFQSRQVHILLTAGYIRGLVDLKTPMVIINYDLPRSDAYARRVNFTNETWIARNTVFLSLIKMDERQKILNLKRELGLRWILHLQHD